MAETEALVYISQRVTMARALVAVFVTVGVVQALWGSASSSLLVPRVSTDNTKTVDTAQQVSSNEYCHTCVKIDKACYNHTQLLELKAPFGERQVVRRMGLMHSNNMLYYTFEPKYEDPEFSKVAYVSLFSEKYNGIIKGWQLFNFVAFGINQDQKRVYLGGTDGIWFVNSTSFVPSFFADKGKTVTNIVSQDYVYFTEDNRPGIIKDKDGNYDFILADKSISEFVFDKAVNYNIVYLSETGLYISFHTKTQPEPVRLSPEPFFRGLTVDTKGAVYAWHVDGIYKVFLGQKGLSETTLKRVSRVAPDAMTFDNQNNIIYSIRNKLYKLAKVNTINCFGD